MNNRMEKERYNNILFYNAHLRVSMATAVFSPSHLSLVAEHQLCRTEGWRPACREIVD